MIFIEGLLFFEEKWRKNQQEEGVVGEETWRREGREAVVRLKRINNLIIKKLLI